MNGEWVKPSGCHNQFNAEPDSIAMSRGGASAGHVHFMSIWFSAGRGHYFVVTVENARCYDKTSVSCI